MRPTVLSKLKKYISNISISNYDVTRFVDSGRMLLGSRVASLIALRLQKRLCRCERFEYRTGVFLENIDTFFAGDRASIFVQDRDSASTDE